MSELVADKALVDAAVAGDCAALEKLLISHLPALERHIGRQMPTDARRELGAEDVLQDVLSQAFRDIKHFENREDASFLAWLKSIADHRLADALKRIGRKKRGGDFNRLSSADVAKTSAVATLIDIVCHDSHLPDDSAMQREAEVAMQVALASLPSNQREAIQARYLWNKGVDEIARDTRRTPGAVRGLIDRGKRKLAEAMGRSSRWLNSR
jgi:RNA polymerase sigma factor (sigma-70 family)